MSAEEQIIKRKASDLLELYDQHFDQIGFDTDHQEAYESVHYFMKNRGKRIRPLLLMLACDMFDGNVEETLNPAFGLELFHNFTLAHDDIMDEADIRRGQPTLHKKYTEGTAILSGDFMMILAYRYLAKVNDEFLSPILDLFNKTATQIIEGQVMDSAFENVTLVSQQEYIKMIEYKTSVLLAASLKIGAIIGRASKSDQELIYDFGKNLGIAFQLKDDWLDAYGGKSVGKTIGGDIMQNKKTYLFIEARNRANVKQKKLLTEIMESCDKEFKLSKTMELYANLDVGQETEQLMNQYFEKAMDSLDKVSVKGEEKLALQSFGFRVYNRGN